MSHHPSFQVEVGSRWQRNNEKPELWTIEADDGTVLKLRRIDAEGTDMIDRRSFREQCAGHVWSRVDAPAAPASAR